MVGESASQVAMLTSVLREREKEVEEVQRRIRAQSLSKVRMMECMHAHIIFKEV